MSYIDAKTFGAGYCLLELREIAPAAPHYHGGAEFVAVAEGKMTATVCGEKYALGAGDVLFADVREVHSYEPDGPCKAYVAICDPAYLGDFLKEQKGKICPTCFKTDVSMLAALYKYYEKSDGSRRTLFAGILDIMLDYVPRSGVKLVTRREKKHNAMVVGIIDYINEHLTDEISLEVLAAEFGYSMPYISRVMNRYIEEGLKSYVNALRVERVAREIENGSARVLATAYKCGFDSANTFYRAYAKRFGTTPRRKRRA